MKCVICGETAGSFKEVVYNKEGKEIRGWVCLGHLPKLGSDRRNPGRVIGSYNHARH